MILVCSSGLAEAGEVWQQVGWFRSDSRNLSVGDTAVRVVSLLDAQRMELSGDFAADSALVARLYPGWAYKDDLVVYYAPTPAGYRQSGFEYKLGAEREALPGDTVSTNLGVFDHQGTRRVKPPAALKALLSDTALVVAARSYNWDEDEEAEWLVVTSATRDSARKAAPQSLRFYNRTGGAWAVEKTIELRDPVRTGPLELRDVTGDGEPDFVYRCFFATPGHYWVDALVFSRHEGFSVMPLPAVFDGGIAAGPVE